jgi:hypothetical protein
MSVIVLPSPFLVGYIKIIFFIKKNVFNLKILKLINLKFKKLFFKKNIIIQQ